LLISVLNRHVGLPTKIDSNYATVTRTLQKYAIKYLTTESIDAIITIGINEWLGAESISSD